MPLLFIDAQLSVWVQVRGLEAIKHFSENLMNPYQPSGNQKASKVEDLEAEVARLRLTVKELEEQVASHR